MIPLAMLSPIDLVKIDLLESNDIASQIGYMGAVFESFLIGK